MNVRAETRVCEFVLEPAGFVRATIRHGAEMTLEDAREALALTARLNGDAPRPVLIDSRGLKSQSKSARDAFSAPEVSQYCTAVALLVGSPVSRMIGNFFLRQRSQPVPTSLFTDEESALRWVMARKS